MLPSFEFIAMVAVAGLIMASTPGPSMLYVLSRSMGQSQTAGFVSSAGLALGGIFHAVMAAFGVAAMIAFVPGLIDVIKFAGALYLLYLGVGMIREKNIKPDEILIEDVAEHSLRRVFMQGIVVELLNPKTILFFIAFLPQFVSPEDPHATIKMLALGMLIPLTAIPSDLIVAVTGGAIANKIAGSSIMQNSLKWLAGGFLVFLAVRLVFSSL